MVKKKKKDPHAVAMAKKRQEKLSPERRAEIAKKAAAKRWKGHVAKRPASSRVSSGRGPGRPKKTVEPKDQREEDRIDAMDAIAARKEARKKGTKSLAEVRALLDKKKTGRKAGNLPEE